MYQFPMTNSNLDQNLMQGGVKLNDFRQNVRENKNTPEFATQLADFSRLNLDIFNYDGDNSTFTRREWKIFMNIFLVTAEDADTAFSNMDRDGDNLLSQDEYYSAGYDYFITCLDPRNAWFHGRPTTCEEIIKNVAASDDPIANGSLNVPAVASIGSISILKLLYTFVPQFPILNTLLGVLGLLPNAIGAVIGTLGGLLNK